MWDFSDEGYKKFKEESEKSISVDLGHSTDEYFQNWKVCLLSIMSRCFLKKTIGLARRSLKLSDGRKNIRRILQLEAKRGKVQRAVVKQYFNILKSKEIMRLEQQRADRLKKNSIPLN